METLLKKFMTGSYLRTNGFTPAIPHVDQMLPGDFFQISNGGIRILGNIFKDRIIDPKDITLQYDIHHSHTNWEIHEGVEKPFFGRKNKRSEYEEAEKDIKAFTFKAPGDFFFQAKDPRSVRIQNWEHIADQLTIKLTQILYSFREVYVTLESAYLQQWVLAIANDYDAELELSVRVSDGGAMDLFEHSSKRAIYAKHIECYLRGTETSLPFFRAKKLAVREERNRLASIDAIRNENAIIGWTDEFYDFDFRIEEDHRNPRYSQIAMIDNLRANELNPTTALEFFHWTDFNLDDIEKLFWK
jgi:hypothetical protein